MATKKISFNTEPHIAEVGPHRLIFQPEIFGDEFLDSYSRLQEVQKELDGADLSKMSGEKVRELYREMRTFLARLMTPEGASDFNRFEVVPDSGGEPLGPYLTREEAGKAALGVAGGATVEDKSIRLPDRVLVELMEWVVTLYAGAGARPTGSSNASARSSSRAGKPGKGASRSRASILASGPSEPS